MSTNVVDASTPLTAPPPYGRGVRGFADRWPFRRKLNALVGVPLAVVALLLSYLIADQVGQARDAAAAAQLVRDSAQVANLVDQVQNEYQQAILLSVRYEAADTGTLPSTTGYRKAQEAVDSQVRKVIRTFGDRLPDTEAQALREVDGLSSLRENVEAGYLPADNIDPAYTSAADGLINGLGLEGNPAISATSTGSTLGSLLRADAAHSAFETSVFSATTGDTNALIEFNNAIGAYALYDYQVERFGRVATEAQVDELDGMEHSTPQATIAQQYAELQVDPSALQTKTPVQIRRALGAALDAYPDYRAQSGIRLKITTSLIGQIAATADFDSDVAWWRAALLLGMAALGFVLWFGFSVAVRRSVVRPVQALTGAAQQVAEVAERELARVADDDTEDAGPPRLRAVPVAARDEIGELAEAFNHVQGTAAALLERQVLSRRNVAEMFGNVGRRVSNLTTRQLSLIDAIERGETDPALLERLYRIDHIAVRLRRNADSLMLLAGIRETVLDGGPTALTNVVRAALGQIEGYQRVRLHADGEAVVEPDIIGDLTLMVAELLENAVAFSPAGSPVEVTVRAGGEGALIEIADHGLGMSAERLAEENARLIRRARLDLMPTKVLGLFVVGSLARRWGVTVTLSRTPGGGVTSRIALPPALLLTMSPVTAERAGHALAPGGPERTSDGDSDHTGTAAGRSTAGRALTAGPDRPAPHPADRGPADPGVMSPAVPTDPGVVGPAAPAATGPVPASVEPADDTGAWTAGGPDAQAYTANGTAARGGDHPDPLPRRVPRRDPAPEEDTPLVPGPRTEPAPGGAPPAGRPGTGEPAAPPHDRPAQKTLPSPHGRPAETAPRGAGPDGEPDVRAHGRGTEHASGPYGHGAAPFPAPRGRGGDAGPVLRSAVGTTPAPGSPAAGENPSGARPLRRRVRGATLRTTLGDAAAQRAAQAPRPADADAVRSALEEFEAAVERAHRDTRAGTGSGAGTRAGAPTPSVLPAPPATPRTTHDQNHLPEGAEQ